MQSFLETHYNTMSNLFLNCGIHSVTMDDIASNTSTSKKTIYKEYKCKDELVRDFFISEYKHFNKDFKLLEMANSNAITQTVQFYFLIHKKIILINPSVLFDLKKYYPALFNEAIALYRETIKGTFLSIIGLGNNENLFLKNIDPASIANLITVLIESCVYNRLLLNSNEWNIAPNHFLDFHFRGICTPVGLDIWEKQKQELLTRYYLNN